MLRKPGQYDASFRSTRSAQSSSRRKTAEGPDDIVRKLQRLPCNKKCADCGARLPQAVNLTFGTFVCLACCGIHREFNHRIKGVGHSAFSTEEAAFLQANGNDVVNAKYLANYNPATERLRPPDGSTGATVDSELLRVWFRRKYVDSAWIVTGGRSATSQSQMHMQPTRAQIPPKGNVQVAPPAPAPAGDLLGGWDSAPAARAPVQAPVANPPSDAAWDAFGQSRSAAPAFQADFGSQNGGNQQPVFQADFGQMSPQQPNPMSPQQQQRQQTYPQQNGYNGNYQPRSPDPPQQQRTQASFNPNFPQPSTPTRLDDSFDASFQQQTMPSQHTQMHQQQQQQQQMNQMNFQQQQQQQQQQQRNHMNFQQQQQQMQQMQNAGYPQINGHNANSHQQQGFNANFQQQQPQVQQQHTFNANFQQQPQPQQQMPHQPPAHEPSQQQPGFNANFSQQQKPSMPSPASPGAAQKPQLNGFANFSQQQQTPGIPSPDVPRQPQQMPPSVPQQQNAFEANFQHQQQPPMPPPVAASQQQNHFNANFQQQQQPQPTMSAPSPTPQEQPSLQANYQQQPPMPPSVSTPVPPQQVHQMPSPVPASQQQDAFHAHFQQASQPAMPTAPAPVPQQPDISNANVPPQQQPPAAGPPEPVQQNAFNANFDQGATAPTLGGGETVMESANASSTNPSMMGTSGGGDPFDAFNALSIGNPGLPSSEPPAVPTPAMEPVPVQEPESVPVPPPVSVPVPPPVSLPIPEPNQQTNVITTANGQNVIRYEPGQNLEYTDSKNNVTTCEVIRSHLDDDLVPFYDIRMSDGREKQTDNAHLSLPSQVTAGLVAETNNKSKEDTIRNITAMLENMNESQLGQLENYIKTLAQSN